MSVKQPYHSHSRVFTYAGCPLSFETGGTMGYNSCFFLNFVPLHIESPYNFGGKKPSAEGKWAAMYVLGSKLRRYCGV
jgi:hypothetical protein